MSSGAEGRASSGADERASSGADERASSGADELRCGSVRGAAMRGFVPPPRAGEHPECVDDAKLARPGGSPGGGAPPAHAAAASGTAAASDDHVVVPSRVRRGICGSARASRDACDLTEAGASPGAVAHGARSSPRERARLRESGAGAARCERRTRVGRGGRVTGPRASPGAREVQSQRRARAPFHAPAPRAARALNELGRRWILTRTGCAASAARERCCLKGGGRTARGSSRLPPRSLAGREVQFWSHGRVRRRTSSD